MKFSSLFSAVFRTSTSTLVLFSVLWLTSCDDEAEPDNTLPELTVTNLADNANVWDVVNISVEATDNRGIDKVEIFADGSLVTSLTAAPYAADWDTNSLTDGAHTVKIVATDKAGNIAEKEIPVTVKNILVSFKVPANHLWSGNGESTRGFVFLSDADGKLIKSVEVQNGQNVEIKVPGFKGETFYLTQANVSIEGTKNYPYLWTFAQVERGKWSLLSENEDDDGTNVGQAKLNFSNAAANAQYEIHAPKGYGAYAQTGTAYSTITLMKTPALLYATRYPVFEGSSVTAAYRAFTNVIVGDNAINLAQVNIPFTKLTPAVPAGMDYVSVQVFASLVANDFTDPYHLGTFHRVNMSDAFLTIDKPGATFTSYYSEAFAESSAYEFSRGAKTIDQINFAMPQYQGKVTFSGNKISSSVTGTFDFVSTSYNNPQNQDAQWSFIMPSGSNVSMTVPVLPEALKTFDIPEINANPGHFEIYDLETMTNYDGLKTFMRSSAYGIDELVELGREYTDIIVFQTSSSGRAKKHSGRHDLTSRKKTVRGN